jgi:hypothetical protein
MSAPAYFGTASERLCSCGNPVYLTDGPGCPGRRVQALCWDCYDGTEDAGARAHVRGFGNDNNEALADWQEAHDEANDL